MDNLEYLESAKEKGKFFDDGDNYKYRKIKALEIIAEELCIANKFKGGRMEIDRLQEIIIEKMREATKKIKP